MGYQCVFFDYLSNNHGTKASGVKISDVVNLFLFLHVVIYNKSIQVDYHRYT